MKQANLFEKMVRNALWEEGLKIKDLAKEIDKPRQSVNSTITGAKFFPHIRVLIVKRLNLSKKLITEGTRV